MRFRYVGPEYEVDLPIPGACIACPKGKWLDVSEQAEAVFVRPDHMEITVRGLLGSPLWEVDGAEGTSKPKRKRKPKAPTPEPEQTPEPEGSTDAAPADEQEQDA